MSPHHLPSVQQPNFSVSTFGPDSIYQKVLDIVRHELKEMDVNPSEMTEWLDLVLLSLDDAWLVNHSPEKIAQQLRARHDRGYFIASGVGAPC